MHVAMLIWILSYRIFEPDGSSLVVIQEPYATQEECVSKGRSLGPAGVYTCTAHIEEHP